MVDNKFEQPKNVEIILNPPDSYILRIQDKSPNHNMQDNSNVAVHKDNIITAVVVDGAGGQGSDGDTIRKSADELANVADKAIFQNNSYTAFGAVSSAVYQETEAYGTIAAMALLPRRTDGKALLNYAVVGDPVVAVISTFPENNAPNGIRQFENSRKGENTDRPKKPSEIQLLNTPQNIATLNVIEQRNRGGTTSTIEGSYGSSRITNSIGGYMTEGEKERTIANIDHGYHEINQDEGEIVIIASDGARIGDWLSESTTLEGEELRMHHDNRVTALRIFQDLVKTQDPETITTLSQRLLVLLRNNYKETDDITIVLVVPKQVKYLAEIA